MHESARNKSNISTYGDKHDQYECPLIHESVCMNCTLYPNQEIISEHTNRALCHAVVSDAKPKIDIIASCVLGGGLNFDLSGDEGVPFPCAFHVRWWNCRKVSQVFRGF